MARMPDANWLGEHSPETPMTAHDIVCIHTIVGFAPAHAAHFSTHDTGRIDQSRDTKFRSAANLDGNHRVIAIENEDAGKDVPLTDAQITACAKILAWAHKVHGVPLQLCPNSKPGSRGLAYHRQGIDGNFDGYDFPGRVSGGEHWSTSFGKVCPRDKRIAQLPEILRRAKLIVNPPPPPEPVTSHPRWAIRTTGVYETLGGTKLRDIPAGYEFQVIDGSGAGTGGWVQTTHGNWVLSADTTIYDPAIPVTAKVGTWNVKKGRSWTGVILPALLNPVDGILTTKKPDVFAMQECYDAPDLAGMVPGYSFRYQGYGYPPKTAGYIEERSEQIILVRDGVEVEIAAALEMTENWKGPNLGLMHDPRVGRRVTIRKNGKVFRFIDNHTPPGISGGYNNDAIAESNAAMVNCLKTFPQDEPIIIVGDWNQTNSAVVTRVGAPGEAVVDGGGIDLAVYKNCKKVAGENLGPFGSDHPVKIWTFEA